jgi:hypothetical protein
VVQLTLPAFSGTCDVAIASGFFTSNVVDQRPVPFQNFQVWNLSGTSSDTGQENRLDLVADGLNGVAGRNGIDFANLDLSDLTASGDAWIGNASTAGTTLPGRAISYSSFEVWSLACRGGETVHQADHGSHPRSANRVPGASRKSVPADPGVCSCQQPISPLAAISSRHSDPCGGISWHWERRAPPPEWWRGCLGTCNPTRLPQHPHRYVKIPDTLTSITQSKYVKVHRHS